MERWVGDIEANGLEPDVIHCAVFKNLDTGEIKKFTPTTIGTLPEFLDTVDELIGHNFFGYDIPAIRNVLGYEYKGKVFDTLVLSRLLDPDRPRVYNNLRASPHGLEAWGYRVGRGKPEHNDWDSYSEDMLHRCTEDVEINVLTYHMLMKEAQQGDWSRAIPMTMKLFEVIEKMTEYGWLVDREQMDLCITDLSKQMEDIEVALDKVLPYRSIAGTEVKKPYKKNGDYCKAVYDWMGEEVKQVASPFCKVTFRKLDVSKRNEIVEYLQSHGWIPQEWNEKDGVRTSPKLSKTDPFDGIDSDEGQMAAKYVQLRHRRSLIEGLVERIRPDGRIPQRITGLAVTGRAKHSNIVNIPNSEAFYGKEIRSIFTVPEDRVLIGVDSDSCQNRMLAARVGDESFTKTILEGTKEDKTTIHYVNQSVLAKAGYEVGYGMTKNIGYAFNFGASDTKLGSMVGGTKEDGARIRVALLSVSAGLEALLDSLQTEWNATAQGEGWKKKNGTIKGLDGRPLKIGSSHALLVYLLQSDEAIMMSYAFLFLYKWMESRGYVWGDDWAYVGWIHDEFQIECKPEIQEEVSELAEKSIEHAGEYLKINIPHIGSADVGRTWADTH